MNKLEEILRSEIVGKALKPAADLLKWGEIVFIIKDSKIVMSEIKQAVKHS
jgi:hypothetical protein